MEPLRFGVRLSSLQTERTGKGSLGAIPTVRYIFMTQELHQTCSTEQFLHNIRCQAVGTLQRW